MTRIVELLASTLLDTELRALELISRGEQHNDIVMKQADTLVELRAAEYRPSADGARLYLTQLGARLLFEGLARETGSLGLRAA